MFLPIVTYGHRVTPPTKVCSVMCKCTCTYADQDPSLQVALSVAPVGLPVVLAFGPFS